MFAQVCKLIGVRVALAGILITGAFGIMPGWAWNTFAGGVGDDGGLAVAADANGNVYLGGLSDAAWGSPVNAFTSGPEALIVKFNNNGVRQWHTFLGGADFDDCEGITVDSAGNIYIVGYSVSSWGTPIRPFTPSYFSMEAFVAKLDPTGVLQWNTFLGGISDDQGYDIALDADGNIYVTGYSRNTWGTPLRPHGTSYADVFVAKLNGSGVLLWNTFLGAGTEEDEGYSIDVTPAGNIYVTGVSDATWGAPVNPFPTGSYSQIVIAKLNTNGMLQWNTFLGGPDGADADGISVDQDENVYIAGDAWLEGWGTPIRPYGGGIVDALVAKFDMDGNLKWFTFLGGTGDEAGFDIATDTAGSVYATGYSTSTWGTPLHAFAGYDDAFVTKLDGNGTLLWNAFLGGTYGDYANAIEAMNGKIYVAGGSNNSWGSPRSGYKGMRDAFVATLDFEPPTVVSSVHVDSSPSKLDSVHYLVTFSEDVTGISPTDFALTTTGITGASVTAVNGSGNSYTVTVNTGSGDGTLYMDIPANATIVDVAGNALSGLPFTGGDGYLIDKNVPTVVSTGCADENATMAVSVNFTVKFSETVTGVDLSDFALTTTGLTGAAVTAVDGSGSTYTVTVDTGLLNENNGTLRLDILDDDSIRDVVDNPLGGPDADNGAFTTGVFYTVIADVARPILLSPSRTDYTDNPSPTFTWSADLKSSSYEIQFAGDAGFTQNVSLVSSLTDPTFTPGAPMADGKYYWRVRSYDSRNQPGNWSLPHSLTIDTLAPAAPLPSAPADGASVRGTPTFRWEAVSGAVLYQFELDNDADFSSPLVSVEQRATYRKPPGVLRGTYSWRMRAQDAAGTWGAWSTPVTVTILPPR